MRMTNWRRVLFFAAGFAVLTSTSCSQPILETERCIGARDSVKKLYSLHLDTESDGEDTRLTKLRGLLSPRIFDELSGKGSVKTDYLTKSVELPKASRVGACREVNGDPQFEVLLFWRRDEINIERKVLVTAKFSDKWVIDAVTATK